MGEAINAHRLEGRVRQNNLRLVFCCGVAVVCRLNIRFQQLLHLRKRRKKSLRDSLALLRAEQALQNLQKAGMRPLQKIADGDLARMHALAARAKNMRIHGALQLLDQLLHLFVQPRQSSVFPIGFRNNAAKLLCNVSECRLRLRNRFHAQFPPSN